MQFGKFLAATVAALGIAGGTLAQAEDLKVGFVYVGPIGDFGWTHEHNIGRLAGACNRLFAQHAEHVDLFRAIL